jgi:hypothetical protein
MYLEFNNDAGGSCMIMQQRKMPAASDKGSQPYSYPPLGVAKWLVKATLHLKPCL